MPLVWKTGDPKYPKSPAFDPYIALALDKDRSNFPLDTKEPWLPILVQLNGITAAQFKGGDGFIDVAELGKWSDAVSVPAFYIDPARGLENTTHCTAFVTEDFFRLLDGNKRASKLIIRVTLGLPLSQEVLPKPKRSKSRAKARP